MQSGAKKPTLLCKGNVDIVDGADLIPIELGGRLAPPPVPINELGRRLLNASLEGNLEEIKWLMNKGAPFTADWLGTSPLHCAAQNNYLNVCELLLRAGISKDARTKVDRTPLHMAASEGHMEIIKCLLRYKADIECRDLLEMTPLHWAVQNGHIDAVSFLISEGALVDVVNKFSLTPIEIAMQCERYDIVEILKSSCFRDSLLAAENLAIQLSEMENSNEEYIPLDTLDQHPNSPFLDTTKLDATEQPPEYDDRLDENTEDEEQNDYTMKEHMLQSSIKLQPSEDSNTFSESIRLLQQHGITMLPMDDNNILSSIFELGRSVVLTDVGKEVLNSTRPTESMVISQPLKNQTLSTSPNCPKIITVTADEFLAMASYQHKLKQTNRELIFTEQKVPIKRTIMKKNKVVPLIKATKIFTTKHDNIMDVKMLVQQLSDARRLAEQYEQKFLEKQAEAEYYKQQIVLLTRNKS